MRKNDGLYKLIKNQIGKTGNLKIAGLISVDRNSNVYGVIDSLEDDIITITDDKFTYTYIISSVIGFSVKKK